ncbi:MAG: endonuclease III [bacterium]|nr:endonuclease III [bacterium]
MKPKAMIKAMVRVLDEKYKGSAWDQDRVRPDPLDALMRTILSQNTTDENRDRGYDTLRERFPTWEQVLGADLQEIKDAIRIAGLANQKGPTMQNFLRWLLAECGKLDLRFLNELASDEAVKLLTQHKGVGIKTAYIVLAFSCDQDLCAVDTHVHRILRRVGIIDDTCSREKAHRELAPLIPKGEARAFHVNLLDFGKDVCTARKPSCEVCSIMSFCRYFKDEVGQKN